MRRAIGISLLAVALAAPTVVAAAQEQEAAKPAPPPRAVERSSGAPSGADRAVPRSAPAPRAESPRASSPTPSTPYASDDSDRSRRGSSDGQSRARTAPPDRRGGGGGERAVPRGGSRDDGRTATGPVQATERDRGGRQSFGTAAPRRFPVDGGGGGWSRPVWYYPYYPLTYGFFWDPWWGYGHPWGYGYGGYGYGGGYYGGGYGYGRYQGPAYQAYGGLRLKVKPREAEVFVDGYFAGIVDDFDGAFQQLNLDVGPHRIEVRHAGYEPLTFEIRSQPDEKITYKGDLKPVP